MPVAAEQGDETELIVLLHGLLVAMDGVEAGAGTLMAKGTDLSAEVRGNILELIVSRGHFVAEMLVDLIRHGSPAVVEALDELQQHGGAPPRT